jgi:glycogen phosphorylase
VLYRPEFAATQKDANEKIWELMSSYIGTDQKSIQRSVINHVEYTLARTRFDFDNLGAYQATGYSVRDRLIEAWNDTQQFHTVSVKSVSNISRGVVKGQQARVLLLT